MYADMWTGPMLSRCIESAPLAPREELGDLYSVCGARMRFRIFAVKNSNEPPRSPRACPSHCGAGSSRDCGAALGRVRMARASCAIFAPDAPLQRWQGQRRVSHCDRRCDCTAGCSLDGATTSYVWAGTHRPVVVGAGNTRTRQQWRGYPEGFIGRGDDTRLSGRAGPYCISGRLAFSLWPALKRSPSVHRSRCIWRSTPPNAFERRGHESGRLASGPR
jgi:hypothetical protein